MLKEVRLDFSPKRIWLGLTIPGKKMVRMLSTAGFMSRGDIVRLYQSGPYETLIMVALALHLTPELGAMGPSLRDIRKPPSPGAGFYGAVFTDIRDFLKLRLRTSDESAWSDETVLDALTSDQVPSGVDPQHPELAIGFTIAALDALSRDRQGQVDVRHALPRLSGLVRATAHTVDPRRGTGSPGQDSIDRLERDAFGD